MSHQSNRWLLPEGVVELMPGPARRIEDLRAAAIENFQHYGYQLVRPPLLEFTESLLVGSGADLDLQTAKIVDQYSGRLMGIRADTTPQIARMDAHHHQGEGPARYCYVGPAIHASGEGPGATREPLQCGAELFGYAGVAGDMEVVELMAASLGALGVSRPYIDLGHVGIFRALADDMELSEQRRYALQKALRSKSESDIRSLIDDWSLAGPAVEKLLTLTGMCGGVAVLDDVEQAMSGFGKAAAGALDELRTIAGSVLRWLPEEALYIDLAELRGYSYHTGLVFSVFSSGSGQALARGGRYDSIGSAFGRARPATGFSMDLRRIADLTGAADNAAERIIAPAGDDEELRQAVAGLRDQGRTVLKLLPGEERPAAAGHLQDRFLEKRDGRWQVIEDGEQSR